ncbi:MAG: lipoyl synthase [Planctomycetota bacterium]
MSARVKDWPGEGAAPKEAPASRRFLVRYARGIGHEEALRLQGEAVARLRRDRSGPGLLLVAEHTPLVTLGRGGSEENLLAGREGLARAGVSFHEAERGGDVAYHGPGQITLYPVYPLEWWGRDLHRALRRLEDVALLYLAGHGVSASRKEGLSGVWAGEEKAAAVGIAVRGWIAFYGLAVNIDPDWAHFRLIRACGIADKGVTGLARLTGRSYDMDREMRRLAAAFARAFDGAELWEEAPAFSSEPVPHRRLPPWLSKRVSARGGDAVRGLLSGLRLSTVCQGARCPNQHECFARGRAAFLIMGPRCTRACRFCAVPHGDPLPLDAEEPGRLAEAVAQLKLRHAVVTSVTRDDLPDGGAEHFARTIRAIRNASACTVEVLTPDFQGKRDALARVADAGPDLFNHNLETVPRLYAGVRPGADYRQSLGLFRFLHGQYPGLLLKSGLMLGLGETRAEVLDVARELAAAGCAVLTLGQYLSPSAEHLPVAEYLRPEAFVELGNAARALGFRHVASAPFVRSSYNAEETLAAITRDGASS